jgi:hypothetical protein
MIRRKVKTHSTITTVARPIAPIFPMPEGARKEDATPALQTPDIFHRKETNADKVTATPS